MKIAHFLDFTWGEKPHVMCESSDDAPCHCGCVEECSVWLGGGWCTHPKIKLADGCFMELEPDAGVADYDQQRVPVDMRWGADGTVSVDDVKEALHN